MPRTEEPVSTEPPTNGDEVVLPGGETVDPQLFTDLEQTLVEHRGGDEGWRNRFNVSSDDPITPFTTPGSMSVKRIAGARHRERSEAAQEADEAFNAPIADSYAQWAAAPNRYDLPGVDTIPKERQMERAQGILQRAERAGAVAEVEEGTITKGSRKGAFQRHERKVKMRPEEELEDERPMFQYPAVLAHEVGHATDRKVFMDLLDQNQVDPEVEELYEKHAEGFDTSYWSQLTLEDDDELREQTRRLSERKRGAISESGSYSEYRSGSEELLADAFASYVIEPRAARREAPRAVEHIEETFLPALERDRGGRPLEGGR